MIKNKMKKNLIQVLLTIIFFITLTSCLKKNNLNANVENPLMPENENEIITTMKLTFDNGTTTTSYMFKDPDGDGGLAGFYGNLSNSLVLQSDSIINLLTNTTYSVSILLLDETKIITDTISNSVLNEGADHMFFFNSLNPSGNPYSVYLTGSMTTVTYLDLDDNLRGIGLSTKWQTPSMAMGKSQLFIMLKHQPSVKNGTFGPGDTDIEIPFKLKIN